MQVNILEENSKNDQKQNNNVFIDKMLRALTVENVTTKLKESFKEFCFILLYQVFTT